MTDPYLPPVQTDCCVDLSHSNDIPDPVSAFAAAKASGVALIIQKATQGTGFIDPTFAARRQAAAQVGILFGSYHFCDGGNVYAQMKHFLDTVGDWSGILLAVDAEKNDASQVSVAQLANAVQYVQETTGRYPLLYMGASGPDGNGMTANAMLSNCDLWLPEYGSRPICPPGFSQWVLHQYTGDGVNGTGHVEGIGDKLDRSYFAGTVADLQTWFAKATAGTAVTAPTTIAPIPAPPANIPVVNHANLTANQSAALAAFDVVNAESFGNWFQRSSFMAFCETESDFDPKAFRQEPSGVASYGLMQVLDSTAAGLGLAGDPAQMYEPKIGILYGLKYAAQGWNYLFTHLGAGHPTLAEWCAGYNEGYGAAAQGRPDQLYVTTWTTNRAKWLYLDAPAQDGAAVSGVTGAQAVSVPTLSASPQEKVTATTPPVAPIQMFNPDDIANMPALEQLQRWLVADGADIEVDGQWGAATLAAIEAAYK